METQLTDTHNRRKNIRLVAERAKANAYPLLTWPEDKTLLRLSDLPVIAGTPNKPTAWASMESSNRFFFVQTDEQLRRLIVVGRAYFCNPTVQQVLGTLVVECKVKHE